MRVRQASPRTRTAAAVRARVREAVAAAAAAHAALHHKQLRRLKQLAGRRVLRLLRGG